MIRLIDKTLIVGPTECGKTKLIQHILSRSPVPYVVYDSSREFSGIPTYTQAASIDWRNRAIAYVPTLEERPDPVAHFEKFCHLVLMRGNRLLVVDEIQRFVRTNFIPARFSELVKQGRHRNVGVAALAQDFSGLEPFIRQCHHIIAFRVYSADLKRADDIFPETGGKRPSEILSSLRPYSFIYWAKANVNRNHAIEVKNPVKIGSS